MKIEGGVMDIQESPIKTDLERQSFQEFMNWWDSVHDSMKCPTYKAWSIWQQAQKVAVAEGFVLVPREPTEALLSKAIRKYLEVSDLSIVTNRMAHLYELIIQEAMIEAQEQVG